MLFRSICIIFSLIFNFSSVQAAEKTELYCRFKTTVLITEPVLRMPGGYYYSAIYYWNSKNPKLRTDRPDGDYCELTMASDTKGNFPENLWFLNQSFEVFQGQYTAKTYTSRGSIYLTGEPIIFPGMVSCIRESDKMPAPFTIDEVIKLSSNLIECRKEPNFGNLKKMIDECTLEWNHWKAMRVKGEEIPAEKIQWLLKELKEKSAAYDVGCPKDFAVPQCFGARKLLDCYEDLKVIVDLKALSPQKSPSNALASSVDCVK